MEMFSLSALPYRATVKRCKNYSQETVNEFKVVAEDVPCKLIAETEGRGSGTFGRTLTGRYNLYFLTTADIKQNDHLAITLKGRVTGDFAIDTCVHLETHIEATAEKTF